ncbi:MAG: hypothetical protein ABEJ89_06920 [Haloarculaceae archaeon]
MIHLYLYTSEGFLPFLLGGLGYLGAVVLLLFNVRRRLLYLVGIPYALLHTVGWAAAGMPDGGWTLAALPVVTLGSVDKLIEIVLIGMLVYLYRNESGAPAYATERQVRG